MQQKGSEIVLHGFFHQRARPNERPRAKMVTRFYTADEGEFFDLDYAEALRLISEAKDEFRAQGFRPRGFVAPAWLLGAEAERAVIDAGMTYTTTLRTVRDFAARQDLPQSLVYSVRSEWRRITAWAGIAGFSLASRAIRCSASASIRPIWLIQESGNRCDSITAEALRDREPMTYRWLAVTRAHSRGPVGQPRRFAALESGLADPRCPALERDNHEPLRSAPAFEV